MTSTKGPIDVFLCPDESEVESPIKDGGQSSASSTFMKVVDGKCLSGGLACVVKYTKPLVCDLK